MAEPAALEFDGLPSFSYPLEDLLAVHRKEDPAGGASDTRRQAEVGNGQLALVPAGRARDVYGCFRIEVDSHGRVG